MPRFSNEVYLKANPRVEKKIIPKRKKVESSLNTPEEDEIEESSLNEKVEEVEEMEEVESDGNE